MKKQPLAIKELGLKIPDSCVPIEFRRKVRKLLREVDDFVHEREKTERPRHYWTKAIILDAFCNFRTEHGRLPLTRELGYDGLPDRNHLKKNGLSIKRICQIMDWPVSARGRPLKEENDPATESNGNVRDSGFYPNMQS